MQGHDIIVIGGSKGSINAMKKLLPELNPDLNASVFFVNHLAPDSPNYFPNFFRDKSALEVKSAEDGEEIKKNRVYLAKPDFHLILEDNKIKLTRGPYENRWRPSIDPLFRSAAAVYGTRCVGIILSGYLDDGVSGLSAIKSCGGVTIVQDPEEAEYTDMPESALKVLQPDYILKADEIPEVLYRLSNQPVDARLPSTPKEIKWEVKMAEAVQSRINMEESIGELTPQTCPDCSGPLWEHKEKNMTRYRCHIGHSYTEKVLLSHQKEIIRSKTYSLFRLLEERKTMLQKILENNSEKSAPASSGKLKNEIEELKEGIAFLETKIFNVVENI